MTFVRKQFAQIHICSEQKWFLYFIPAGLLYIWSILQPQLMFAGKAWILPKNGATERCFTGVGLGLTRIFTGKAVTVTTGRILISMYSWPVCYSRRDDTSSNGSTNCRFDQLPLRPIATSTNCRFDQLPLRPIAASTNCRFDQLPLWPIAASTNCRFDQLPLHRKY